jgi:Sulfite exporter TauE/SafE
MIDLGLAANSLPLIGAGFGVGFLVGLTGGWALMTPLLISTFGVTPQVAVGTDLLYASITKTAGSWRHHVAENSDWAIVFGSPREASLPRFSCSPRSPSSRSTPPRLPIGSAWVLSLLCR